MPYFDTDRHVIDHQNGDVYLWDRESNNIKPLALQAGTTPLSADTVKITMLTMQKDLSPAAHPTDSFKGFCQDPHNLQDTMIPIGSMQKILTLESPINPSTIDQRQSSNHLADRLQSKLRNLAMVLLPSVPSS